jgi:hypothetical protein
MLKRIIKCFMIEQTIAKLIGPADAVTLSAIITFEWFKFRLRYRAVNRAVREVCHG